MGTEIAMMTAVPNPRRSVCRMALLSASILGGCVTVGHETAVTFREVSLAEFAQASGDAAAPRPMEDQPREVGQAGDETVEARTDQERPSNAAAVARPDPELMAPRRAWRHMRPGQSLIVESLVGQVNGRPIFADEFFEPIEDELIALAERQSPRDFMAAARRIIDERLRQVILNELFLAEAEAGLSVEQQQGLLALMQQVREEVRRQHGGSITAADRSIMEREGLSYEEYLSQYREEQLILNVYQEKIRSRVIVSSRDVERAYQQRYDEFNPPATVTLGRIRLSTEGDAAVIDQVRSRLEAGEPFAEVADAVGMPDHGRWDAFTIGPDGPWDIDLNEDARSKLVGLEIGQTSEPFQIGASTWWLHVISIDRRPGKSLYEAQMQIRRELAAQLEAEARQRYVATLLDQGIFDELTVMGERLLRIGVQRYAR